MTLEEFMADTETMPEDFDKVDALDLREILERGFRYEVMLVAHPALLRRDGNDWITYGFRRTDNSGRDLIMDYHKDTPIRMEKGGYVTTEELIRHAAEYRLTHLMANWVPRK